jgi:RNA-directed DNA polymerase
MNGARSTTGKPEATSNVALSEQWEAIDWNKAQHYVSKLQARIAKARQDGRLKRERRLTYLLTHSFYAKALAVRQVTSSRGKATPGIDKVIWNSPTKKMKAVYSLTDKRYRAKPLRRVYIPKPGKTAKRPLGIPTMYDRAMQALYLYALDPIIETTSDDNSYGFRKGRCAADANRHLHTALSRKDRATWVLEGDIRGCFDNISHLWLLENIPMDRSILVQFLKAGYTFGSELFPTDAGTPQGGVISATLANACLNGLQDVLTKRFKTSSRKGIPSNKVTYVRYADDFLVTAASEAVAQEAKGIIKEFLSQRGLELSDEKTIITHIEKGFDFLGWNFRKYKGKLIIKPSQKAISRIIEECKRIIKIYGNQKTQAELIGILNPKIKGWTNYHKCACSSKTFSKVDSEIFLALWRHAIRLHSHKGKRWIADRYWKKVGTRKWVFTDGEATLVKASDTKIRYHALVRKDKNPYIDNEYFVSRKKRR